MDICYTRITVSRCRCNCHTISNQSKFLMYFRSKFCQSVFVAFVFTQICSSALIVVQDRFIQVREYARSPLSLPSTASPFHFVASIVDRMQMGETSVLTPAVSVSFRLTSERVGLRSASEKL